jgi:microsomal prostaglandin-E synthase 2
MNSTASTQAAKLYQYEVCPFCWKARVGLALKKAPFEKIEVHPLNKKELSFSDYKKVPVYIDSKGEQVNDSNIILKHIDKEFTSGPKLCAEDGTEAKKLENYWLEWSEKYVKAIPPLIYDTVPNALKAFNYITKVGNFSSLQKMTIKYSGALVMKMVAKKSKERQNIQDPKAHVKTLLKEWADAVGTQSFRGGNTPDITDAAVFGITMSVRDLPAFSIMQENAAFNAWMKRMSEQTGIPLAVA